jgi:predicted Zn-dependent peptidase
MNCLYEGTSLKNLITGSAATVDRITLRGLEEYRKRVFTKENCFFYLTGNYTDSDVEYIVEKIGAAELFRGEIHDNYAPVPQNFKKRDAAVAL